MLHIFSQFVRYQKDVQVLCIIYGFPEAHDSVDPWDNCTLALLGCCLSYSVQSLNPVLGLLFIKLNNSSFHKNRDDFVYSQFNTFLNYEFHLIALGITLKKVYLIGKLNIVFLNESKLALDSLIT